MMTACMHIYNTNTTAGSAASGRIQYAATTGAVGRRLQHPGCGKKNEISLQRNPWNFYFNPTVWLTSA